jgi:hypothetical protein
MIITNEVIKFHSASFKLTQCYVSPLCTYAALTAVINTTLGTVSKYFRYKGHDSRTPTFVAKSKPKIKHA